MAGIRVTNPIGDDWEYSLDATNWQYQPVFNSLPDGAPFVDGVEYPVYSRNLVLDTAFVDTIEFTAKDNNDTLDVVVRRGAKGKQGWTDALVKLMGGLFLDKIPTTTLDYPRLVIAPDGRVYKYGGTVTDTPEPLFSFVHWQAVATAKTEKSRAVVAAGSITELTPYNAKLIVTYSDNSTEDRTTLQDWYFYADTFQLGQKDYANKTGIYILDADTVDGPGHVGTVRAVEKVNGVDVVRDLTVTIINAPTDPAGSVDVHTCEDIQGWCADKSNPGKPYSVRIEINGQYVATVTAQFERTDVAPNIGLDPKYKTFGWRYKLPEVYRNNQEHNLKVFLGDTQKQCTYNVALALTCNAPTVEPQPTGDYFIAGEEVVREGGDGVVQSLKEVLNNGLDRNYPGNDVIWSKPGGPAGLNLATTGDRQALVSLAANSINGTQYQNIQAQIPGHTVSKRLQLIETGCTRDSGLTSYKASYRIVQPGSARGYTSLDDANNTAGRHFDGSAPGNLDLFDIQVASLTIGKKVHLGLTQDCAVVSNEIYYITDSNGANTVKTAIQVVDGVIVAVKVSSYSSEIRPPNTGDCVGYGKLTQEQYNALPDRTPTGDPNGSFVFQFILEYVDDTQPTNSVDRVRTFKSRTEAITEIAKGSAGKVNFDIAKTSQPGFAVGTTVYGNNDPILRPTDEGYYWPIEAGFVACESTATQYVLLTLNNCGQITNRETIQR